MSQFELENGNFVEYSYTINENNIAKAYWSFNDSVGKVKNGISQIDLDDESDKREYCFLADSELIPMRKIEQEDINNKLCGIELQWLEGNNFETKALSLHEAEEFSKWFDYNIGTEYEKVGNKDGVIFSLYDIETDEEISLLKNIVINDLEEKSRVVFKLNNLDTIFVSKWVKDDDVENLRIAFSQKIGSKNFDFRFDESEYDKYTDLDDEVISDGAIVVNLDDVDNIIKENSLKNNNMENKTEFSQKDWDELVDRSKKELKDTQNIKQE